MFFELGDVPNVCGIVVEATEMDTVTLGQMAEHVPRPDLVALLGRVGHAMRKKEQVGHRGTSPESNDGVARVALDTKLSPAVSKHFAKDGG